MIKQMIFLALGILYMPLVLSQHHSYQIEDLTFVLTGDTKGFEVEMTSKTLEKELHILTLRLTSDKPQSPAPLELSFIQQGYDIQALYHPEMAFLKTWLIPWEHLKFTNEDDGYYSSAFRNAPVYSLYNSSGVNRLTFACSEIVDPVVMGGFIHSTNPEFKCFIKLFTRPHEPVTDYSINIRIDQRSQQLQTSLSEITNWWKTIHEISQMDAPENAVVPYYSTWYTFNRELYDDEVDVQAKLASELGCEAIILDDGWQQEKDTLGADFYGDWQPAENRFPEFEKHIEKVQSYGMDYLVWHALPLVGEQTEAYQKFKGKFLFYLEWARAWIPDPRFPEVRKYYVDAVARNMKTYNLDGMKLDFFEQFWYENPDKYESGNGRDYFSVEEAGLKMLDDIIKTAKNINPDVLIEFRQQYIGPAMWPYANLFRANDCQYSLIDNRASCMDIRLMNPNLIVHSDMLTWNTQESPEVAAKQLLNVFFTVPQISVNLEKVPQGHRDMIKFLLSKWTEYKTTLVQSNIFAAGIEMKSPYIEAYDDNKLVAMFYADMIPEITTGGKEKMLLVNGKDSDIIRIDFENVDDKSYQIITYSCTGNIINQKITSLKTGVNEFEVPVSGLVEIKLISSNN
jgi:alpha-galactosidase